METESCEWYEYKCKSGETLFFYNAVTGEHRWPNWSNSYSSADDTESNSFEIEARDPPPHQYSEQGMFLRSIGTQTEDATALEDVADANTTSNDRDVSKTYSSTGSETDINGVSDSKVLNALFNCALSVCSAEKVCRDESVKESSVSQTKGEYGGSFNICEDQQLEMEHEQLEKSENGDMMISSFINDDVQEQRVVSHKATANLDEENAGEMVNRGLVDGQTYLENEIEAVPQISSGRHYDEPISDNLNEPELKNELLDGRHDTDVEIIPSVSCIASSGAAGKENSTNELSKWKEQEIVISHCLEDDLDTSSSEMGHEKERANESSSPSTICNMEAESSNEMSAECLDNRVTREEAHAFLGLEERDEIAGKGFPQESHDKPDVELSLDREEFDKLNNDGNKQIIFSSVTDRENALGKVEDKTLSISGELCCTDTIQEQSISTGEGRFKCTQCEKTFKFSSYLVCHVRNHTGERPFKCTQCNKAYTTRSHLSTHLLIHTGKKPYKCPLCEKDFKVRCELVPHLRTHTGERPYKCTLCGKAFKHSSNRSAHFRIHSEERPYKCTQCDKAFKTRSNFSKHLGLHTQERLHKCTQCERKYKWRYELVSHLRIHTGERPYKCFLCHKAFIMRSQLTEHLRIFTHQ